ncbi:hypothetical protein DSCA_07250 [Desulfosarcina alkanivorans]|jgi:hypothetical protein|uniref:Uncharacterized protein n=1 Tax=Desulfosarcina alkanivorans TaxID=571177 RepID=A0A5K7YEC5_9BACT|nr:hypothetical protein [Desulfosarcina alkanivorans]BBO66795.1 hypothetical protein DSCA_07250 [Desulfosarcina alkanivorans]
MIEKDDNSRFTIRSGDAEPESMYMADAENLRIEKLSTRITLVAVLIPCLLVIVLAVAYLDIKNRVINTQNTGSMGVQNLSKDLESRFSNLSLKQAKLDARLAENTNELKKATAALQVNLQKSTAAFNRIADDKADRSAIKAVTQKTDAAIAALQKDMADLNTAFDKFDDELATQVQLMADGLKKDQGRLAAIEKKSRQLESEKMSRESMNLALGLERLGLQEMVKEKIREVEKKLTAMRKQVDALNQRLNDQAGQASSPVPTASVSPPPPAGNTGSTGIEEQTIE